VWINGVRLERVKGAAALLVSEGVEVGGGV